VSELRDPSFGFGLTRLPSRLGIRPYPGFFRAASSFGFGLLPGPGRLGLGHEIRGPSFGFSFPRHLLPPQVADPIGFGSWSRLSFSALFGDLAHVFGPANLFQLAGLRCVTLHVAPLDDPDHRWIGWGWRRSRHRDSLLGRYSETLDDLFFVIAIGPVQPIEHTSTQLVIALPGPACDLR
jgi:hypothetical protein